MAGAATCPASTVEGGVGRRPGTTTGAVPGSTVTGVGTVTPATTLCGTSGRAGRPTGATGSPTATVASPDVTAGRDVDVGTTTVTSA